MKVDKKQAKIAAAAIGDVLNEKRINKIDGYAAICSMKDALEDEFAEDGIMVSRVGPAASQSGPLPPEGSTIFPIEDIFDESDEKDAAVTNLIRSIQQTVNAAPVGYKQGYAALSICKALLETIYGISGTTSVSTVRPTGDHDMVFQTDIPADSPVPPLEALWANKKPGGEIH